MKPALFIILMATLIISPFPTSQNKNRIASGKITFEFVSKDVDGTINGFQSNSNIDLENIENSVFDGSVAVSTLDTNNGLRNWSLKGRKYFDEVDHPKITFKSESVEVSKDGFIVKGNLTLKGITKPLQISFSRNNKLLVGKAQLYTSDFDIHIKKKREENLVNVRFAFEID